MRQNPEQHRSTQVPAVSPLARMALLATLAVLGMLHLGQVVGMLAWEWNGARTAPSVALARGIPLYVGPETGAIASTYYGPVKALLFLPAGLAQTPTGAILIAGLINAVLLLFPMALVGRFMASSIRLSWQTSLWGFALAASTLPLFPPTLEMVSNLHVDAPAVGLGLMSCILLVRAQTTSSPVRFVGAAICTVLAVWSKQVEAPMILAQILWLAWRWGRGVALRYTLLTGGIGVAISLCFVLFFGWNEMTFNLFVLPASLPYRHDLETIVLAVVELAVNSAPFILLPLISLRSICRGGQNERSAALRANPWILLVLVAIFIAPTSLASRLIVGGHVNSFHSVYYLVAATVAVAVCWRPEKPFAVGSLRLHGIAILVVATTTIAAFRFGLRVPIQLLEENQFQQAYELALAHPRQIYFPWQTLSTLMADGELYHFEYSVGDRINAGLEPSEAHWRAHLPADLHYVAYREQPLSTTAVRFLPIQSAATPIPNLPGWKWYAVQRLP